MPGENLIVNGSFEDVTGLTPTSFGYTGSPVGWTDANGVQVEIVNSGHVGQGASDGSQWIDSEAAWQNLDISQTIPGLTDGASYDLSFDLAEWSASGSAELNVYWNGALIHTHVGDNAGLNTYETLSFSVTAQDGDNVLRFEEVGGLDAAGVAIDNVSLYAAAVPCFLSGTRIATPDGATAIERLRPGDLVLTLDNGPQPVVWAGRWTLGPRELRAAPHLRPIRLRAGAVGNAADLMLSPQHRILTRNPLHLEAGSSEGLIRAKHLAEHLGGPFRVMSGRRSVTYHHILLERHELVFAEGTPAETMLADAWATGPEGASYTPALRRHDGGEIAVPDAGCRPLVRNNVLKRARKHLGPAHIAEFRRC